MRREFIPVNVAVLTVSDSRTLDTDTSGELIADRLAEVGHQIVARELVTPRDVTPEALAPLISKPIPGFGELFRWLSYDEIGTSTIQSRAEAALCGTTYVFLLPGSTGGVRTGLEKILIPQLDNRFEPCNFVMLLPRIRSERSEGQA